MTTFDDSTRVVLGMLTFLFIVVVYVWTALALSAVFRKSGQQSWKAWVPFLNQAVLLRLGGFSGWLILIVFVPIVGLVIVWALLIVACYRISLAFGHGVGMTVLAALVLPVWASILGFGPDRWIAADDASTRGPEVGPRRAYAAQVAAAEYVPRATAPAYSPPPSTPPAYRQPPAAAPAAFTPPASPMPSYADWAPPAQTPVPPVPSLPASAAAAYARMGIDDETETRASRPSASDSDVDEMTQAPASGTPSSRRSAAESPDPARENGKWGGFDLGAAVEMTSEVTGADSRAPGPISAVPARDADQASIPPVTRVPAAPEPARSAEPWAPARSPLPDPGAFSETSGEVSALVGAPDAGAPRSARASVSALHASDDGSDDALDQTIITRRRRTAWTIILPTGGLVPITAEVVIIGRKPVPDGAFPDAQLVPIDDGTVSKTHARLVLRDERWYITDLGSTNGVLFATLMGTEVEATPGVEIEAGDHFFLGDAELRVQRSDG